MIIEDIWCDLCKEKIKQITVKREDVKGSEINICNQCFSLAPEYVKVDIIEL